MKKRLVFLSMIIILILCFSFINKSIISQESLPPELGKIGEIGEKLTDEEARDSYLKQEWGKILEKNKFYIQYLKPIGDVYKKISPYTNPIFNFFLGIIPGLNWLFLLTLVLWIFFVFYIVNSMELMAIFSKFTQYIISLGVIIIISAIRIPKLIAGYLIKAISILGNTWVQLAVAFIILIAIIIGVFLSKNFKDFAKALKEKREKDKEKLNRRKLEGAVKVGEILGKSLKK